MTPLETAVAKFHAAEDESNAVIIGQQKLVRELWMANAAQYNTLLLGERGIAKTMGTDVMMTHLAPDVKKFYQLCSKAMPYELIVGNISLRALRDPDLDSLRYNIKGKLPDVHIGVLDEVFKTNAVVLNTLLGIINEREFEGVKCPLWCVIGASNLDEYHITGELEPFRDRFTSALLIEPVTDDASFRLILEGQVDRFAHNTRLPAANTVLTMDDMLTLQQATREVTHPNVVMEAMLTLRKRAEEEGLRPSARRFGALLNRMAAQAVFNGRSETSTSDMTLAQDTLWTDIEDRPKAFELIMDYAGQAVSTAVKLRKALEPLANSLTELKTQVDSQPDQQATNDQFGQFGRYLSDTKKLETMVESAMDTAIASNEDVSELQAVARDLENARKIIKAQLGM